MRHRSSSHPLRTFFSFLAPAPALAGTPGLLAAIPPQSKEPPVTTIHYHRSKVGDVDPFYREAGPVDTPVLLHGIPSVSHMFRHLRAQTICCHVPRS